MVAQKNLTPQQAFNLCSSMKGKARSGYWQKLKVLLVDAPEKTPFRKQCQLQCTGCFAMLQPMVGQL